MPAPSQAPATAAMIIETSVSGATATAVTKITACVIVGRA